MLKVSQPFVGKGFASHWNQVSRETFPIGRLTNNTLLLALPSIDFARLLPHLQMVSFNSGEDIYQPDGTSEFLYFPETAVFSQLNILADGRTVETAMIGYEGIAGLSTILSFQPKTFWTQTLIAGIALRINAKNFKPEFGRGGFLQAVLLDYINLYVAHISQRAICNIHHRIEERFCSWLLMLDDRNRKSRLILTQEQIAYFLGVHRPTLTLIAQDLRNNGIIDYIRGRIFILNRQKLEQSACECYSLTKKNLAYLSYNQTD
ncbi:MAG: Crp/Fnr family transcriptional regulator [Acidobacteria bacterium]|nr:Crp/Fnr family transcriptional regulator [Acidobacteriota bacterium]